MTGDELRQRTVLTVREWAEVMSIKSESAAYRAVDRGDAEGAFKINGSWRIPVAPVLRRLRMEPADDNDNVTPLRNVG